MGTDEQQLPAGIQRYFDFRDKAIGDVTKEWPWLNFGQDYVAHDYQFDSADFFNFLRKRKYATYHDAEMDGYVPRTKDIALLDAQLLLRISVLKADQEMIAGLRQGSTNEGAPLAMEDSSSGYRPVGLREFRVVHPDALEELRADGSLQRCLDRGTIFEAQSGAYVELVEVYAHPDIAAHLKKTIAKTYATIMAEWKRSTKKPSAIRRALNFMSSKGGERKAGL